MSIESPQADPLYAQPRAERPAYATGMLLDAQDFSDEQTYHRGRLARALAFLAGGSTLAGLSASHVAATPTQVEELRVAAGVAVDRLGRLVEVPRPACIRLLRWYEQQRALDGGDSLQRAAYGNLGRFVSPRLADAGTALPARAVVADVFLRFAACKVGLTPSFAQGPFDALNAVSTSRLRDAYELLLVLRDGLDDDYNGLPQPIGGALPADAGAPTGQRRNAAQDAVLAAYQPHEAATLPPAAEHPAALDASAVFLARVFFPVAAANPPTRTADAPVVDNFGRRFAPPAALLAQWVGI